MCSSGGGGGGGGDGRSFLSLAAEHAKANGLDRPSSAASAATDVVSPTYGPPQGTTPARLPQDGGNGMSVGVNPGVSSLNITRTRKRGTGSGSASTPAGGTGLNIPT